MGLAPPSVRFFGIGKVWIGRAGQARPVSVGKMGTMKISNRELVDWYWRPREVRGLCRGNTERITAGSNYFSKGRKKSLEISKYPQSE